MSECRAAGCDRKIAGHKWFCAPCWRVVPQPVRERMFDAFVPGLKIQSADFIRAFRDAVVIIRDIRSPMVRR